MFQKEPCVPGKPSAEKARVQIPPGAPQMLPAQIFEYLLSRRKLGFRDQTLRTDSVILRFLAKKTDLTPDSVLTYLANSKVSACRKANLATVYAGFAKHFGIPFQKPHYRREERFRSYLQTRRLKLSSIVSGIFSMLPLSDCSRRLVCG